MLAQNFQSADELLITEQQRQALIKTLTLLETNKLKHFRRKKVNLDTGEVEDERLNFCFGKEPISQFNMNIWRANTTCGTVACIGGTAELVGQVYFGVDHRMLPPNLYNLFYPGFEASFIEGAYDHITTEHAAQALRNYLTTGEPNWFDILSELLILK